MSCPPQQDSPRVTELAKVSATDDPAAMPRVLFICTALQDLAPAYQIRQALYEDLTAAFLAEVLPDIAILPLWNGRVDAIQILQRLDRLGFAGTGLVQCPDLPDLAQVAAELQAQFPNIRLILLPSDARLPL